MSESLEWHLTCMLPDQEHTRKFTISLSEEQRRFPRSDSYSNGIEEPDKTSENGAMSEAREHAREGSRGGNVRLVMFL